MLRGLYWYGYRDFSLLRRALVGWWIYPGMILSGLLGKIPLGQTFFNAKKIRASFDGRFSCGVVGYSLSHPCIPTPEMKMTGPYWHTHDLSGLLGQGFRFYAGHTA